MRISQLRSMTGLGLMASLALAAPPAFAAETVLGQYTVSDVAEQVSPAVVSITTEFKQAMVRGRGRRPSPHDFPDLFGRGIPGAPPQEAHPEGVASGVIISADGYIVTNNHVVHDANEIRVKLGDQRLLTAKLIGTDEASDLALIKVNGTGLPFLKFGNSASLRLGEIVLAVGNPFNVGQTVTMGIVSAKGRNVGILDNGYEDFIQTDAAINPGNSGGALVNLKSELVGINTAILSKSGGGQGIGFAVPSNMVRPIIDQIRQNGHVRRGWLGVAIQDLTPELAQGLETKTDRGVVISDVIEKGPAARAGVQQGDVVVKINGEQVASASALRNMVAMIGPGASVKLTVVRQSATKDIDVKLDQKKDGAEEQQMQSPSEGPMSGLSLQDLTPELRRQLELPSKVSQGVVVAEVDPRSKAGRAGLKEGDVIISVNRKPVGSVSQIQGVIEKGRALLRIFRNGQGGGGYLFIALDG